MSYDSWKLRSDMDGEQRAYYGPSRQQVLDKMAELQKEIEWNIRRLGYLVLSDEDREQTEDLIEELRGELNSLSWCFGGA